MSPVSSSPIVQMPKPFMKWGGSKLKLLGQYAPFFPSSFGNYIEPFVGGGAVFFHLRAQARIKNALLSDANHEVVDCYVAIRDDVQAVIDALRPHVYEKKYYYDVRALDPARLPLPDRAARLIYLLKTCYNGLCRVNSIGQFNTPFGKYVNPTICDVPTLQACAQALQGVAIECADFRAVSSRPQSGDFVYLDPPYVPLSDTSNFTAYTPGGFGKHDQQALAAVFRQLDQRGVLVMLSNSETPLVRQLYAGFRIDVVSANRSINSKATKRGAIAELVVRNY